MYLIRTFSFLLAILLQCHRPVHVKVYLEDVLVHDSDLCAWWILMDGGLCTLSLYVHTWTDATFPETIRWLAFHVQWARIEFPHHEELCWHFYWLVMGNVKVVLYCCLIANILTKVLQRCSLSSLLPNIWILSKPLNLISCHGNQKDKFAKKYSKIISSEAVRGMKLKLCRNIHNIN